MLGSTISNNQDSGIEIGTGGKINNNFVKLFNSQIIDNLTGDSGGGVNVQGTDNELFMVNNKITGNWAGINGGEISVEIGNTVVLGNNKITGNIADSDNDGTGDGGGLFIGLGASVAIAQTKITDNLDLGDEFPNIFGDLINFGGNQS